MRFFLSVFAFWFMASTVYADTKRWQAEGWKTDFSKRAIDVGEVLSGGPPKDGIPPIDEPKFVGVSVATDLAPNDPVIGLTIGGDARAYPLRVMTWHEIVNDVVGGRPVTITYCPLCNAALVFDATVDGEALSFGTTGKLRNSDLIMYDRKTESWWQQFSGTGIAGTHTGKRLRLVASRLESWAEFSTRHPTGKVLVPNNPNLRAYGRNPYVNYDISSSPFLYNGALPEGISPMARVVVVREDDKPPFIVSMATVREAKSYQANGIELQWRSGQSSALHAENIAKGRDVGTITARRIKSKEALVYDVTFAFVAHAFHPKITIRQK